MDKLFILLHDDHDCDSAFTDTQFNSAHENFDSAYDIGKNYQGMVLELLNF